jgi:molybdopterin-guanine dinucleotide biosynthesis protein A
LRSAVVLSSILDNKLMPGQFSNESSSLLEYVLDALWTVADEIILVFNYNPELTIIDSIAPIGVKIIISDNNSNIISNISMGLKICKSEYCLVVMGNLPFIKPNVAMKLFDLARGYDAAIPRWSNGKIDTNIVAYRRNSFLKAQSQLTNSDDPISIINMLYSTNFVSIEELRQLDPELNSFFKVISDTDLEKAKQISEFKL